MKWNHSILHYKNNLQELPEDELIVFGYLLMRGKEKTSQKRLAKVLFINISLVPLRDSMIRKARSVVRSLRVDYGIPVLSDGKGYWLPDNIEEVQVWIDNAARRAQSQARAWFETYKAVKNSTGAKACYFDKQLHLFDENFL